MTSAGFGLAGTPVTPRDLTLWTWSALARGAKGINYYAWYPMSSGYESGGFGLNHLDGAITERARTAGRIAQVVDRHQALFLEARPVAAEVAIVYNPLSHFVGGRQRAADHSRNLGAQRQALAQPGRQSAVEVVVMPVSDHVEQPDEAAGPAAALVVVDHVDGFLSVPEFAE